MYKTNENMWIVQPSNEKTTLWYELICYLCWLQDLESKEMVDELRPELVSQSSKAVPIQCLSLAWSTDGQTLFAGYSDNTIRVWQVSVSAR